MDVPAVAAYITGKITAEELFTIPLQDCPYVVLDDTIYNKTFEGLSGYPAMDASSLPISSKTIQEIQVLIDTPLEEFAHIQSIMAKGKSEISPVFTDYQAIPRPIPLQELSGTPAPSTCSDVTLDSQYQAAKAKIIADDIKDLLNEVTLTDKLLMSSASPCAKRGRIKTFLTIYNAVMK